MINRSKSRLTNYFTTFFDITYVLCCSPFRLKYSTTNSAYGHVKHKSSEFIVSTWWPQKVLYTVFTVLNSIWLVRELRPATLHKKNAALIFLAVMRVVNCLIKLTVVKVFWTNQKKIIHLINYIFSKEGREILVKDARILSKLSFTGILYLYLAIALLDSVTGRGISTTGMSRHPHHISQWSWDWWWSTIKNEGYFNLFLGEELRTQTTDQINHESLEERRMDSIWAVLVGVFTAIGWCYRYAWHASSINGFSND